LKNDQFGLPHSWHWKVRSSAFSSGKVGLKATKSDCPVQYWQAIGVMQPYNGERASLVGAVGFVVHEIATGSRHSGSPSR